VLAIGMLLSLGALTSCWRCSQCEKKQSEMRKSDKYYANVIRRQCFQLAYDSTHNS